MLSQRYNSLSDREKLTLWGGGLLVLLLVGYLALWRPLSAANASLQQQLDAKAALSGWMARAAEEAKQLQRQRPATGNTPLPLKQLITSHSARLNLNLERMQGQSDKDVQLWLKAAPFNQLLLLLDSLSQQGVLVAKANLRASGDAGVVDAHLTFRR